MAARRTPDQLFNDALAIWQAGVAAVRGEQLIADNVRLVEGGVQLANDWIDVAPFRRLRVVGGGKAAAAMAAGIELALEPLADQLEIDGWLNIPQGTERSLKHLHLHVARPAGINEPTSAAVAGTERILDMVAECGPSDWLWVVLTGGGSALLPAPLEGLTLDDKIQVTRTLSESGANILELNTVRRALSRIKGGGLLKQGKPGRIDVLILSDVLGDPLEAIASGPTIASSGNAAEALEVLRKFDPERRLVSANVYDALQKRMVEESQPVTPEKVSEFSRLHQAQHAAELPRVLEHHVLGNLAVAVDAAGIEAERRGYSHAMSAARKPEGDVKEVAKHWAKMARTMQQGPGPDCLISGGEPTVTLAKSEVRGRGGRNQQLVVEAWLELRRASEVQHSMDSEQTDRSMVAVNHNPLQGMVLLSGGTDGEDGPTQAAGGWISEHVDQRAEALQLDLTKAAATNSTFDLLSAAEGLLITGSTGTNVCDLRVIVVDRIESAESL